MDGRSTYTIIHPEHENSGGFFCTWSSEELPTDTFLYFSRRDLDDPRPLSSPKIDGKMYLSWKTDKKTCTSRGKMWQTHLRPADLKPTGMSKHYPLGFSMTGAEYLGHFALKRKRCLKNKSENTVTHQHRLSTTTQRKGTHGVKPRFPNLTWPFKIFKMSPLCGAYKRLFVRWIYRSTWRASGTEISSFTLWFFSIDHL